MRQHGLDFGQRRGSARTAPGGDPPLSVLLDQDGRGYRCYLKPAAPGTRRPSGAGPQRVDRRDDNRASKLRSDVGSTVAA